MLPAPAGWVVVVGCVCWCVCDGVVSFVAAVVSRPETHAHAHARTHHRQTRVATPAGPGGPGGGPGLSLLGMFLGESSKATARARCARSASPSSSPTEGRTCWEAQGQGPGLPGRTRVCLSYSPRRTNDLASLSALSVVQQPPPSAPASCASKPDGDGTPQSARLFFGPAACVCLPIVATHQQPGGRRRRPSLAACRRHCPVATRHRSACARVRAYACLVAGDMSDLRVPQSGLE